MATMEERKMFTGQQYLASHKVRWLLAVVSSELLHLRPSDPLRYIASRVSEIRNDLTS